MKEKAKKLKRRKGAPKKPRGDPDAPIDFPSIRADEDPSIEPEGTGDQEPRVSAGDEKGKSQLAKRKSTAVKTVSTTLQKIHDKLRDRTELLK